MASEPKSGVAADLRQRFMPEARFGGFSRHDGMIEFYSRIAALVRPGDRVLDYGAGRGAQIAEDHIPFRRALKILKGRCAHLEGCDIAADVMENPYLDSARVFDPRRPLPYPDASFDLVYSNWVFEHVADPTFVAAELLRVVKPGGYICAITPNKRGYISLAARTVPNARHVGLLSRIQPTRKEMDVFPTHYRLNTPGAIRRHFAAADEIAVYSVSGDPSYTFGRPWLYRAFMLLHAITPAALQPVMLIFVRKAR